ncbi:MAG TPA: phosphatase PAP2 family protein [Acidimicrobiales bacterium]|nr:phosphatase PAP2 family protein [Acidimicrobiales bacterium]
MRRGILGELSRLDRAVYDAVAGQDTPGLDRPLRALSRIADKSVLWAGLSVGLGVLGGDPGRRAATRAMASVAVTSAVANLGLKPLSARRRPRRDRHALPSERVVTMPGSSSFPSGHSASAFAFATAVGTEMPALALPMGALATLVAYSRVHTGVHYPGDVIAGAVIGVAVGHVVTRQIDRRVGATAGLVAVGAEQTAPAFLPSDDTGGVGHAHGR